MITVHARLDSEDLERYRRIEAQRQAARDNPRAYSADATEKIIYEWFVICGELFDRYEVEAEEDWKISPTDGTIYYGDG